MAHSIRLASERVDFSVPSDKAPPQLFTPGMVISQESGFMRGHGTYGEDDSIKASVAGIVDRVNKLVVIKPLKSRYNGEIGDVVVGRITEVQQKRWKVDTNARLDATLFLYSVNLPGGELRRRSVEDEQMMRKYLTEGDLISAEVQNINSDGSLSLHTRSLKNIKYGKLGQGMLIKVFPSLIKRQKTHFHNLPCGASIILGNNGFIWISPVINAEEEHGGFTINLEDAVPKSVREVMVRLRNSINALAASKILLFDTSIQYAYDQSKKYSVVELLNPEVMLDVAVMTQHQLQMLE
ncbi:unnamed protein product [Bemisia tabaci]|uniref:Ribosomal RNA-processing protein 4 n=1 Tax=Bemisia tabaci TaxID=7038 RepID=A0A9P0EZA6_BEMTA|nr:PREDICTED: exosome complex component RRP4 [Bemisia tabaci]CAH0382133.1 unnamed protein product [Bemisia tabaci]